MYHLLVIIITFVVDNVEEAKLIDTLAGRNNAKPVAQLLLLEELLGPVHCQSLASQHPMLMVTYKYFK